MDDSLTLHSVAGTDARMRIAGPGARAYAFLIDWHVRVIIGFLLFLLGAAFQFVVRMELLLWLPALIVYALYHPVLEWQLRGRTPGKRRAGLRIVTAEGGVPGLGPILVRNVLRIVDSLPAFYTLGFVACMVDGRARRLGDMAAGTLLVEAERDHEGAFEALSARRSSTLDPALAELASDLVERWEELQPARREALAGKVLQRAGVEAAEGDPLPRLLTLLARES